MSTEEKKLSKAFIIATDIENKIVNGVYEIGSPIPSQNELSIYYSTSSRSVREAFKLLETRGMIALHQGKPATVVAGSSRQMMNSLSISVITEADNDLGKVYRDLMHVLTTFSTNAVRAVCQTRETKQEGIASLIQYQKEMEENYHTNKIVYKAEVKFLKTLMSLTDNLVLSSIFSSLEEVMTTCLSKTMFDNEQNKKRAKEYLMLITAISEGTQDIAVAMILMLLNTLKQEADRIFPVDDDIKFNFA